jgi:hypothetical protein
MTPAMESSHLDPSGDPVEVERIVRAHLNEISVRDRWMVVFRLLADLLGDPLQREVAVCDRRGFAYAYLVPPWRMVALLATPEQRSELRNRFLRSERIWPQEAVRKVIANCDPNETRTLLS